MTSRDYVAVIVNSRKRCVIISTWDLPYGSIQSEACVSCNSTCGEMMGFEAPLCLKVYSPRSRITTYKVQYNILSPLCLPAAQ
jgi:hypothetical protein